MLSVFQFCFVVSVRLEPPVAVTRAAYFLGRQDLFAHFPAQNICNQATARPIPLHPYSGNTPLGRPHRRHYITAASNFLSAQKWSASKRNSDIRYGHLFFCFCLFVCFKLYVSHSHMYPCTQFLTFRTALCLHRHKKLQFKLADTEVKLAVCRCTSCLFWLCFYSPAALFWHTRDSLLQT